MSARGGGIGARRCAFAAFRRLPGFLGFVIAATLGCQSPGSRWTHPWPDVDTLAADVAWLAAPEREGRGLGSEGLRASAEWLAERFQEAGLEPGGDEGYFQHFETTVALELEEAALAAPDQGLAFDAERDFLPLRLSDSGEFEGEAIFAGFGIQAPDEGYDDYEGLEVQDRVVLVLEGRPEEGALAGREGVPFLQRRAKIATARRLGVRAILFVVDDPETDTEGPDPAPDLARGLREAEPGATSVGLFAMRIAPVVARALTDTVGPRLADLRERARRGRRSSTPLGVRVTGSVRIARSQGRVTNVVGWRPGSDPALREEAVVVGAHYDHLGRGGYGSLAPGRRGEIHPGADDNASGTAALLAIARGLESQEPLRRSIVFVAFTAEEAGLLGSSIFVRERPEGLPAPVAMLNMDMVGRLRENRIIVFGAESARQWPALLEDAAATHGLLPSFEGSGYGPSDQTPFHAAKVPVLHVFTGTHPDYHTPGDTIGDVDPLGLARVTGFVSDLTRRVGDAEEKLAFVGDAAAAHPGSGAARGYGPDLGTIPAFGDPAVIGVRLAGVRAGSPAERADLQAGDVIVGFAGTPVRDLAEFAALLFAERPGRIVRLDYVRDGEPLSTEATLGPRR